jgi:uncharacterized membrane protein YfcA
VTVLVMIWLGISPQSAIASARVASLGTMTAGLRQFHQHGKVDYKLALRTSVLGILGACIGAYLILGTLIGSTFGAKYALKKGDKWIEAIFNISVIILSLRMIF